MRYSGIFILGIMFGMITQGYLKLPFRHFPIDENKAYEGMDVKYAAGDNYYSRCAYGKLVYIKSEDEVVVDWRQCKGPFSFPEMLVVHNSRELVKRTNR